MKGRYKKAEMFIELYETLQYHILTGTNEENSESFVEFFRYAHKIQRKKHDSTIEIRVFRGNHCFMYYYELLQAKKRHLAWLFVTRILY